MASVTLDGVSKTFGGNLIVNDINLEIEDGSFTVLLGPSGCGKTTTLNMICGLESLSAGRILFNDQEVQDLEPHKRDVAMVFQSYALYPNRTVRENIQFALKLRKMPRDEIVARTDEAADMLGISGLLDRRPRQLSGGQQQRVALARSIVRRPNVFLLDEPLSNLDAKLRAEMRIGLRELQHKLGGTFVYVTHDQGEAMSMADQVVVMNDGVIQQDAPPLSVYRQPANQFVAGFVGTPSMNFVTGAVESGEFRRGAWRLPVDGGTSQSEVTLGVRPEDLVPVPDDRGTWTVRLVERLGVEAHVLIGEDGQEGHLVSRTEADIPLSAGQQVSLQVREGKTFLFDPDSGASLSKVSA